jgi:hypothetical protein
LHYNYTRKNKLFCGLWYVVMDWTMMVFLSFYLLKKYLIDGIPFSLILSSKSQKWTLMVSLSFFLYFANLKYEP